MLTWRLGQYVHSMYKFQVEYCGQRIVGKVDQDFFRDRDIDTMTSVVTKLEFPVVENMCIT